MSGATVSQETLARTVKATLRVFATRVLHREPVSEPRAALRLADFRLAAFIAMAALSVLVQLFGRRRRLWFLGSTFIVLGLVFGFFLSIADVVRLAFGIAFSPVELVPRLALIGIALGLTVAPSGGTTARCSAPTAPCRSFSTQSPRSGRPCRPGWTRPCAPAST